MPRNERGNVEAPPFARALPRGTRHLRAPGLAPVCRALGIDHAPALVGFELQSGRMVPRIDGVVVCEEHAGLVMDALAQHKEERARRAAEARRRAVEAAWRQLIRTLLYRVRMDRSMAADAGGAGAGAGGAAAAAAGSGSGGGSGNGPRTAKEALKRLAAEQQADAGAGGDDAAQARKRARTSGGGGGGVDDGNVQEQQQEQQAQGRRQQQQEERQQQEQLQAMLLDGVDVEEI